jgi:hypothetical protein
MWSLPDINRMNNEAAANAGNLEAAYETGVLEGEKLTCEHEDDNCAGALRHYLWYDIFSDDPKGILTLCERHDGYYGSPAEGYFWCRDCHRVMTENYTWELCYVVSDHGELLCLPCHAKRELRNLDNWIPLMPEDIARITFKHVRQAKHLIGVRMPVPEDIEEFGEGVTLDSSTGGKVRGFTHADNDPADGVEELKAVLLDAMNAGHKRAILILDGAYQFAVSIGVYVPTKSEEYDA